MPDPLPNKGPSPTGRPAQQTGGRFTIEPSPIESLTYGSDFFLKALLTGDAKTGKTTGAATAPRPILWIDTDQGKESLVGLSSISLLTPSRMQDLHEIQRWIDAQLRSGSFPYATIVLDSITRLYSYGLDFAKLMDPARGPGGTPVTTHWLAQKNQCQTLIEFLIHAPIHFVATVHEAPEKDELLGKVTIRPDVTGKDSGWITQRFGEVYNCFTKSESSKEGERVIYRWRTQPEPQRPYLGSRMNTGSRYWDPIVEPSFELLMRKRGVWPEPGKEVPAPIN